MHLFPRNGNRMAESSQQLIIGVIRLDIQTPFPLVQSLNQQIRFCTR